MIMTNEELYQIAKDVNDNTYSPYSKFAVSCAVLTDEGEIFTGVNVENASYGLTICAERTAIGAAVSAGYKKFKSIAIYVPAKTAPPCGACRQFIIEFGSDIDIIFKFNEEVVCRKISELLPYKFEF